MTHVGRERKTRNFESKKYQLVFELEPPKTVVPNAIVLSRVGLETLDPFASCPFNMDSHASKLCDSFFGTNQGYSATLRSAWSFAGFYDDMAFQTLLSMSVLYLYTLRTGKLLTEDTIESLQLHNKALHMLRQRLDDPIQHTSDGLISGMAGFLVYDYVLADFTGWNRHMDGLLKMIELRGGFGTLKDERLHLVLSWADLCGSFSLDIPPRLPLPSTWLQSIALPLNVDTSCRSRFIYDLWSHELPEAREWLSMYELLFTLLSDVEKPRNTWMEAILYRLLSLRPLHTTSTRTRASVIEEVCRTGTILFLAPIWRSIGIHPVRTTRVRQSLLSLLNGYLVEWGKLRILLLWALAHAVRESQEDVEQGDFTSRLLMVMRKMELATWQDAVKEIRRVLCMDELDESWEPVETAIKQATRPSCRRNDPCLVDSIATNRM